jgi:hypothetical protein
MWKRKLIRSGVKNSIIMLPMCVGRRCGVVMCFFWLACGRCQQPKEEKEGTSN